MGTLFVVATPIGNLEDMTFRAVRTLREVLLVAAEDTRTSGRLLRHFDIDTPLTSYFEHNKLDKLDTILAALNRGDVALISDAGTPMISDPGYELVQAVWDAGHRVVPIPGPSAVTTALSVAGLPTDRVVFLGFLPRQAGPRRTLLKRYANAEETLVFYEAPHRIRETVDLLVELVGPERPIVLSRELTKLHETIWRGDLAEAAGYLAITEPRGEYTVLLAATPESSQTWDDDAVQRALLRLEADGVTGSRAVKEVARLAGRPRSEIYDLWLSLQ